MTNTNEFQIWVDADACPKIARDLIIKIAIRTKKIATFVANRSIQLQKSPYIVMKVVASGFDVADDYIVNQCNQGDLVLTNDIPMANDSISKGAKVMNFKGFIYTKENIKQSLNMRDFMDVMRGSGMLDPTEMGGQKPYSEKNKQAFANGLNRMVN